jgi:hypothetical protein
MIRRLALGTVSILIVFACSGPSASSSSTLGPAPSSTITQAFPDSRVSVQVAFSRDYGRLVVLASFSPTETGIHLYGTEMSDGGIDGAGRPTRLRIDDPGWRASGPVTATPAAEELKVLGFDQPFPVYPDGPVGLQQEVVQLDPGDRSIDLVIGFMACSSRGVCYLPVWDARLTVGVD